MVFTRWQFTFGWWRKHFVSSLSQFSFFEKHSSNLLPREVTFKHFWQKEIIFHHVQSTHTHTHTHMYIYVYMYMQKSFMKQYLTFLNIMRSDIFYLVYWILFFFNVCDSPCDVPVVFSAMKVWLPQLLSTAGGQSSAVSPSRDSLSSESWHAQGHTSWDDHIQWGRMY